MLLKKAIENQIDQHLLHRYLVYGPRSKLIIASNAVVNNALFNTVCGKIEIHPFVFFGHSVSIITGSHDYNKFYQKRMDTVSGECRDIVINCGAWIGSGSIIIGPCIIGEHSVVAAGAVVTHDVPAYTIVGGVPAKQIKKIVNNHNIN